MAYQDLFRGTEQFFSHDDIIVSKTDLKGRLIYANQTFVDISGYSERELLNKPHSILRHEAMPRSVFKLLWDSIESHHEIFAFVVNKTKGGDYYWVLAHVTPSYDANGNLNGYHSNRRVPQANVVEQKIKPLYAMLLEEEEKHANRKDGMLSAYHKLLGLLKEKGLTYDEFLFSLTR